MKHVKTFETFDINEATDKVYNLKKELYKNLSLAVKTAGKIGKIAQDDPDSADSFSGTEGNTVSQYLIKVWNAFSTGDPTNDEYQDEVFK